ncbi:Pre-mRNA-splicing factor syf2 [Halotydeus destructor]|nr:Pre-mRNA-splicing factor syf2 [Halotydeus destructor]
MSEPEASGSSSFRAAFTEAQKRTERMEKLRQLHAKRTEASKLNHQEVVEEYKRNKMPANWEKKKEWAEHKLTEEEKKDKAAASGQDYERLKLLEVQADEAERWDRKKGFEKEHRPWFQWL